MRRGKVWPSDASPSVTIMARSGEQAKTVWARYTAGQPLIVPVVGFTRTMRPSVFRAGRCLGMVLGVSFGVVVLFLKGGGLGGVEVQGCSG
jgi:hypothetical protein